MRDLAERETQAVQLSLFQEAADPRAEYIREQRRLLRYCGYGRSLREYHKNINPRQLMPDGTIRPISFEEWCPEGDVSL